MNRRGGPPGEGLRRNIAKVKPEGDPNAPAEVPSPRVLSTRGQYAKYGIKCR